MQNFKFLLDSSMDVDAFVGCLSFKDVEQHIDELLASDASANALICKLWPDTILAKLPILLNKGVDTEVVVHRLLASYSFGEIVDTLIEKGVTLDQAVQGMTTQEIVENLDILAHYGANIEKLGCTQYY